VAPSDELLLVYLIIQMLPAKSKLASL